MIDLLRQLLDLRERLEAIAQNVRAYGLRESLPEVGQMQDIERKISDKVSEWDKPDKPGLVRVPPLAKTQ